MKVPHQAKYKLIFSTFYHEHLGLLIHPHVVAYTQADTLSLTYQKVFSGNASHYDRLTEQELDLVASLDPLMVEHIVKLFSPVPKIRPKDFFKKHFNKDLLKKTIRPHIEKTIYRFLQQLPLEAKSLYIADDINPAARRVLQNDDYTKALFHFRRNENGTIYFITLKYEDEKIPYMKQGAMLLSSNPACMIVHGRLHRFYDFLDGNKLAVFLNKKYVMVKPDQERSYYQKFILPLLETAPVFAQGFEIETKKDNATPVISLARVADSFGFHLRIGYGQSSFLYKPAKLFYAELQWLADEPKFTRYKRSKIWEQNRIVALEALGVVWNDQYELFSLADLSLSTTIDWLRKNRDVLKSGGFEVQTTLDETYSTLSPKLNYQINDKIDWFDLNAIITIGDEEIPFERVVKAMKKGLDHLILKNGETFLFPQEWFALGQALIGQQAKNGTYTIKKYQLDILSLVKSKDIKKHLNKLVDIKSETPHSSFAGALRPYQVDGLSWLMFLRNNHFGGILADDMGLGKTIQTLAFLQRIKYEKHATESQTNSPYLLITPTSLIYNWVQEAKKFTPDLSITIHSGTKRAKVIESILPSDILITTYGVLRNDIALFEQASFDTIVLDESQNIKNTSAKTTQYINKLNAHCRIALTGTPIENTVKDLWSQMNFLNKGLLGSLKSFEEKYAKPIEKKGDKEKSKELQALIKPFLLRRTKEEVATDLPPLTEKVIYCDMSIDQKKYYEKVKSKYRNNFLDVIEEKGIQKSKLSILQGLSKLRQIANHPILIDTEYAGDSGKHTFIVEKMCQAVRDGHKVLVFSQFVSYLHLLKAALKERKVKHLILTGSTTKEKRASLVSDFQADADPLVFLISLKAGGTGLNLTAADYVFIVDPWWNPAAEAQARDRTHRIGQQNSVFSYKFISKDTIEEKITQLQAKKEGYAKELISTENNILANLDISGLQFLLS